LLARLIKANVPVGYVTPVFYQTAADSGGQTVGDLTCTDITQGNNDTAPAGGYSAGPRYDAVTGWGSPKGRALAQVLSGQPVSSAQATST
jgi:kumamolisin